MNNIRLCNITMCTMLISSLLYVIQVKVKFLATFPNWQVYRPGGVVVVYVCNKLTCMRGPDLDIRGLEAVWVEIKTK